MAKYKDFEDLTDEEFDEIEPKIKAAAEKNRTVLGVTQVDAYKIAYDDWRIDHGDRCDWEPSVEEEKAARKANKIVGARDPKVKNEKPKSKPVRAEDPVKRSLIEALRETLAEYEGTSDLVITNPERVIAFALGDDHYEITLTKKRKPKA